MPRLQGVKQRRHQPFYDTLFRLYGSPVAANGFPTSNLGASTVIFGNASVGQLQLTNLQVPGQLASDQTFAILALRNYLFFDGTNRRVLYLGVSSQLYWTLQLGDKPQFQCPSWYLPAGGGIFGYDSTAFTAYTAGSIFSNGEPSQEAILKLARPILVPVRQAIQVRADFFKVGAYDALNGTSPSINSAAVNDQMVCIYMIDGVQTRDVE